MQARSPYESLITWFAANHVAANLLMAVLILGGLVSAFTIKKEIQPRIDPNQVTVTVPFLGASPDEVEEGVIVKIEEAIQDIEGIDTITSYARRGQGEVVVQVKQAYAAQTVLDEVKLRVDGISTFPEQTEEPVITKSEFQQAVMWISVFGEVGERTLKEYAKQVRDEIVGLPGVTRAQVVGARDYEIGIEVSEATLREYGLTLQQVANAVGQGSLDLPAGSIESSGGDILLRTKGQAYTGEDFERIVVRTNPDGTRLRVGDIATVDDGFEERPRHTLHNGQPAVAIRVDSVGNQSELAISSTVRDYIEEKKAGMPSGVNVEAWADVSYYLKGRLDMMNKNLAAGAALVFMILALFLRLKLAFWVMVGLPVAFLGTMWVMQVPDVTINMLSLFGFILVLGIVVDDAIIIGESVYTQIRRDGHSLDNVVRGTLRVAIPATFGVLTTAAAFLPILMVTGVSGQFFAAIGWVVILAMGFSLVESKLILPAHLAHMRLKPPEQHRNNRFFRLQRRFSEGLHRFVDNFYMPLLKQALHRRYLTISIFIAALILSIGIIKGLLRVVLFPDFAGDFIQMTLRMNDGTPPAVTRRALDRTREALEAVESKIAQEQNLPPDSVVDTAFLFLDGDTRGEMVVELIKSENAAVSAEVVEDRWRNEIGDIPGARQLSFASGGGPSSGAAVSYDLVGRDLKQLKQVAARLEHKVNTYEGVYDVRNSFEGGNREIKLDLKPEARNLGLTLQDLANQVRNAFYGAEVQRIQRGDDEIKVMVRFPRQQRRSVGYLEDMGIRTPEGAEVPFGAVAEVDFSSTPSVIRRFNRERAISVTAEVDKDIAEPGKINSDIRDNFLPDLLAQFPGVDYRLSGATEDQEQLKRDLLIGGGFALFLIYALMAIPLRSYFQPLLVMSVVPFGMIGAVVGHLLLGLPISMLSAFGIIALAGVVVNDSLILVDFVNRGRRQGMALQEAAMESAASRFRPVVLTSLTTFLGLAPIVFFEKSLQAEIVIPMAASLAFGIVFATVNTLFMIPSLYLVGEDIKHALGRLWRWFTGRPPATGKDLVSDSH